MSASCACVCTCIHTCIWTRKGSWLFGCRTSVAEHWLHKLGVLGLIPGDCCLFHFPQFRFPISVYAHIHSLKLCSPSELRRRFALHLWPCSLALTLALSLTVAFVTHSGPCLAFGFQYRMEIDCKRAHTGFIALSFPSNPPSNLLYI